MHVFEIPPEIEYDELSSSEINALVEGKVSSFNLGGPTHHWAPDNPMEHVRPYKPFMVPEGYIPKNVTAWLRRKANEDAAVLRELEEYRQQKLATKRELGRLAYAIRKQESEKYLAEIRASYDAERAVRDELEAQAEDRADRQGDTGELVSMFDPRTRKWVFWTRSEFDAITSSNPLTASFDEDT